MSLHDVGSAVRRAGRGVHWYLREWSGEARWDRYLEECEQHGHAPMSRRAYERQRADAAELHPASRCC